MPSPSDLTALLGIRHPLIQAPMAGVSSPAMAAAVGGAGALGSIGIGAAGVEEARRMIRAVRAVGDRPFNGSFNVNVFCHAPARPRPEVERAWIARLAPEFARLGAPAPTALREIYTSFRADPAALAMLLEERPAVVSFHFGLPSAAAIQALRAAGIRLLATATSLEEGRLIHAAGVDVVVAQGWEAGGHRGVFNPDAPDERLGTLALVRVLAAALPIPVVAAGGIMDGAGIAAALRAGAAGVQLGTAFLNTDESLADAAYRAHLASPAAARTVMTRAISGRPARGLPNRLTALGEGVAADAIPAYPIAYDAGKALNAAAKTQAESQGEQGYGAHWAGQGAPHARALPASALIAALVREYEAACPS